MVGIVLCTHSNFAEGCKNSVEMIAGLQENLFAVNFDGFTDLVELSEQLKEAGSKCDEGCIYLVDMMNATPYNAALMAIAYTDNIVLAGLSLPMLLELVISRNLEDETVHTLVQRVMESKNDYVGYTTSNDVFK
ncbi:MAG: PTS sugar transporter subunit IIA [Erysipelotrichaceae bacterium]